MSDTTSTSFLFIVLVFQARHRFQKAALVLHEIIFNMATTFSPQRTPSLAQSQHPTEGKLLSYRDGVNRLRYLRSRGVLGPGTTMLSFLRQIRNILSTTSLSTASAGPQG